MQDLDRQRSRESAGANFQGDGVEAHLEGNFEIVPVITLGAAKRRAGYCQERVEGWEWPGPAKAVPQPLQPQVTPARPFRRCSFHSHTLRYFRLSSKGSLRQAAVDVHVQKNRVLRPGGGPPLGGPAT